MNRTGKMLLAAGLALAATIAQTDAQSAPPVTAEVREQVIDTLLRRLEAAYVFPDVARKMDEAIRRRLKSGEYDRISSGEVLARTLTEHLQEVSKDRHLRVGFSAQPLPPQPEGPPSGEALSRMRQLMAEANFGFEKVERLPGNIGLIDLRGFMDAEAGAETVAAAMNLVANTDALIFDLRQNGGGSPYMVRLICSYLFDGKPIHLNSLHWREGDRTDEFWTLENLPAKRYVGKDVYVLTSRRTFSGAEEFAYNLKNLKRVTVVGETTGGGAHPGGGFRINDHFSAFIPAGRAVNPITKTNWEGTGVAPDVEVPADRALKTAHALALKKLIEREPDPERRDQLRKALASLGE